MRRAAAAFATAEAAEDAFYDAMQRGDLAAMMSLWADDEDVVCVHPSGARLVGLQAIRASFEEIFAQGGVDVRPADPRVHLGALVAVHNLVEKVVVSGRQGTEVVECVATNVYVKDAAGWRIVVHHSAPAGESPSTEIGGDSTVLH
jgi:uncharacterized protein (TIGR02246 family)